MNMIAFKHPVLDEGAIWMVLDVLTLDLPDSPLEDSL
jgi:hypothetical protein